MEIKVNFLDNLRLEAKFDDFTVIADQPISSPTSTPILPRPAPAALCT